jgi:type IV pilus assembly protein PilX
VTTRRLQPRLVSGPARNRGVVVVIALLVLVSMLLAVAAMMRMVSGTTGTTGNIAFKEWAMQASERAVGRAVSALDPAANGLLTIGDNAEADQPSVNYRASIQAADARGIPTILLDTAAFDAAFPAATARVALGSGETMRYLIERLCTTAGPADDARCFAEANSERGGSQPSLKTGAETGALYRITVRVDGVKNTLHFTQVVFRPS